MHFARVVLCSFALLFLYFPLRAVAQEEAPKEADVETAPKNEDPSGTQDVEGAEAGASSVPVAGHSKPKDGNSKEPGLDEPHPGTFFRLNKYVFDTAGVLSPAELDQIQLRALSFTQETGFPLAVVILGNLKETGIAGGDVNAVARQLLNQFMEGRTDEGAQKAFVILISIKDRLIRIQKGKKWNEAVSGPIQNIIEDIMVPHLKAGKIDDPSKDLDYAGATLKCINKMLEVLYAYRVVEKPILSASIDRFASKSWLWILLGLHLLGLVYVLCTKESEGWYLAGILFGLPILIAMLIFVIQGDEDVLEQDVRTQFKAFGKGRSTGNRSTVWGYW